MHKSYILDTNVFLTEASCVYNYGKNDIVIPLKILDEIDKHKKRQDVVGSHARKTIRFLDSLRVFGNLSNGVSISPDHGRLTVRGYDPFSLPDDLDMEDSDNQIIATALSEIKRSPDQEVVLVTRDINMRVKCDSLNIKTEDYNLERVVDDLEGLYAGHRELESTAEEVDRIYKEGLVKSASASLDLYPNECIVYSDVVNPKKAVMTIYKKASDSCSLIKTFSKSAVWGVHPRNKEQVLALNLLMDPTIPVVTLVGQAGSGKTLLALAAALEQTFGANCRYKKLLVTKPVEPVGKDIGFLPGTLEEKMLPWLAPIQDNLQFLLGDDKMTLDMYVQEGKIEIEAMTYIRGRSIANSFIIIDEAQNINQHEIKTILTRVGEGTKIVLTGDVEQIDNVYVDEKNNGLSYVVEKFKHGELSAHITLRKGERSPVATMAAKLL